MSMKCLDTGKVCSNTNKKCKECMLDECRGVFKMLEIQEKHIREEQLERLNKYLPKECVNCPHLEIINLRNMEVRCFYKVKDKCTLK